MRTHLAAVVAFAMLLFHVPGLSASEPQELREKAQMAKQKAEELKKLGRADEAEKVARKAMELVETAERLEGKRAGVSEQEIDKLQGHLKGLLDKERQLKDSGASEGDLAGVREQIAKTERELGRLQAGPKKQPGQRGKPWPGQVPKDEALAKLEDAGRRIKHLRIAAKHLHEAGAHDLADQLMEKAEVMEREAEVAKRHMAEEKERHLGPELRDEPGLPAQIEGLRREVERLRDELHELRKHVDELERAGR